jgi:hypothetical protein
MPVTACQVLYVCLCIQQLCMYVCYVLCYVCISSKHTRKHIRAQSYGVDPYDKNSGPSFSDLFNLYATSNASNSDRSNDIFDQITDDTTGACLPAYSEPKCEVPAHKSTSKTTAEWSNLVWQPPADRRGDIARAMFYMQVWSLCMCMYTFVFCALGDGRSHATRAMFYMQVSNND